MRKSLTTDGKSPAEARIYARSQMPIAKKWAYFDHAAVAPLPSPTQVAISNWLEQATVDGDTCWLDWSRNVENLRANVARLVHAEPDEVALIPNTSTGISLIAEGLSWKEGDNVVLPDDEFPSNSLPWQHLKSRGVEIRRVPYVARGAYSIDAIARAIDHRTRLLTVSWVGFSSGLKTPLEPLCELAQSKKVLFLLDAIQGLGVFPLDLSRLPIDFVAADGHKWMLGPEGAGFLFIRKKWLESIRPSVTGWGSVEQSWKFSAHDFRWKPSASRFEAGSMNMMGMTGFGASLEFLLGLGCHQEGNPVQVAVLQNALTLTERLQGIGAQLQIPVDDSFRSGIVSFEMKGQDPDHVRANLMKAGIVVSVRQGKLRASTHLYNDETDIDRMIEQLSR